jgi:hypothetical protein
MIPYAKSLGLGKSAPWGDRPKEISPSSYLKAMIIT